MYSHTFLVTSVRGKASLPMMAASFALGMSGFMKAAFGVRFATAGAAAGFTAGAAFLAAGAAAFLAAGAAAFLAAGAAAFLAAGAAAFFAAGAAAFLAGAAAAAFTAGVIAFFAGAFFAVAMVLFPRWTLVFKPVNNGLFRRLFHWLGDAN